VPFELFVALRFLREGRGQTALILAGTTVGVAVIVFLTALIGGLQDTLIDQTLSSQPHVVLMRPERVPRVLPPPPGTALAALVERAPERERSVEQWQQVLASVRETPGVLAATPMASGAAFASRAEVSRSVSIRGVEPESFDAVIRIAGTVREGRYRIEGGECLIGTELATALGLAVGDRLRLATAEGRADLFTVTGLFDIGSKEVNERWVLVSLRSAQTLLDLSGGITAIEAKVRDVFEAERIAQALGARTGLASDSWMRSNKRLLDGLRSQSASSYMIQTFVILAVALGIASVLGVSVIQKSREIGILKATGTSTGTVMRIFLIEGGIVGVVGSVAGGALGALLSFVFQLSVTNPYGESLFPIALSPRLFLVAGLVATATGLAAAWLPARRAALLDPAVVIRNG